MTFVGDFHFLRPAWFSLAPIAIAIWWWGRSAQDPLRGWRAVINTELLSALTVGADSRGQWRHAVLPAAWLLTILAVAGPTWRPEPSPFADDPVPVMILLKAGETMSLADLEPSRMERARLKVADLADERKGQPLGLAAYAGSAHLVLPPTRDTEVFANMAAEISPRIMPKRGDDLVAALRLAKRILQDSGGSVVVVADTVDSSNQASLAEFRAETRLPVFFLAVARDDTPELDAIQRAAIALRADVILMTPDGEDVRSLVWSTSTALVMTGEADEETRWAEAGWWLVPVVALLSLTTFRRVNYGKREELS